MLPRPRGDDLRVVGAHRRRRRPRRRRRRRSPHDGRSRSALPTANLSVDRRALRVRPAHPIAEIREQLGDPAHPDAADADEVNAVRLAEHVHPAHFLCRRAPTPGRQCALPHPAVRTSPSPPPSVVDAARHPASARIARGQPLTGELTLLDHLGAADAAQSPRRSCAGDRRSPSAAARESPARLAAASSDSVVAPARATTRSAARHLPIHLEQEGLDAGFDARRRWYASRTSSTSRSPVWWVIANRVPAAASRVAASTMATLIACAP